MNKKKTKKTQHNSEKNPKTLREQYKGVQYHKAINKETVKLFRRR